MLLGGFGNAAKSWFGKSDKSKDEKERLEKEIEKEKDKKELEKLRKQLADLKKGDKEDKKDKEDNKDDKKKDDTKLIESNPKAQNAYVQNLLTMVEKSAENEKDEEKKQKYLEMTKTIRECSTGENGEPLGFAEIGKNIENKTGMKPNEWLEKNGVKKLTAKESEDLQKSINKEIEKQGAESFEKNAEEGVSKSKTLIAQAKKEGDKEEPKKDADGNIVKTEQVTDPKTGKKIKVATHTGPRGGKFYWPEGKPKTPKNKVYVKESLSEWLDERFKS